MVDLAKLAKENSISLEAKKDRLAQRQSSDWSVTFTVQDADMDPKFTSAKMGTRYAMVLVEINDDETPVNHNAEDRDKWRALGPTKQAGILCKEAIFWAFLRESRHQFREVRDEASAAAAVRNYCGVASRSEFSKPGFHNSRTLWHNLDNEFQAWKANENA